MGDVSLPKPHSLRLSRATEAQVRAFARTLAREKAVRIPMGKALATLVEAGLNSLRAAASPSPREGLLLALRELDPAWSGKIPQDREAIPVTTTSGRTPVEILLERRGG